MIVLEPFDFASRLAGRVAELEPQGASAAPAPVVVAPAIVAAVGEALLGGETHYTSRPGLPALRARIAEALVRLGAPAYDPDTGVVITAGERESLFVTLLGLRVRGASVWTAGDSSRYASLFRFMGLTPHDIAAREPNDGSGGLLYRERAAAARAHEEWSRIVSESPLVDVLNVAGAIGSSGAPLPPIVPDRTIVIGGLDRLPGDAAFGAGFVAGPPALIGPVRTWKQAFSICTAAPSQRAALTALDAQEKEIS